MDEDAKRIVNLPYFKWRSDSAIQTTLNVLVGAIFFGLVGWDSVATHMYNFQDRWLHLILIVFGSSLSAAFIFQNRHLVRVAHWVAAGLMFGNVAGVMLRFFGRVPAVSALALLALVASLLLALYASIRMRSAHWAEYVQYCSQPEQLPRPSVDRAG